MKYLKIHYVFLTLIVGFFTFSCGFMFLSQSEDIGIKTSNYTFSSLDPSWKILDDTDADHAYYNESMQGLIYVNSYCGKYLNAPLDTLVKNATFGIKKLEMQKKYPITINNLSGLNTLFIGINNDTTYYVNYIVLKSNICIFDFSFIIPMTKYELGAKVFEQFAHSFKLKDLR